MWSGWNWSPVSSAGLIHYSNHNRSALLVIDRTDASNNLRMWEEAMKSLEKLIISGEELFFR